MRTPSRLRHAMMVLPLFALAVSVASEPPTSPVTPLPSSPLTSLPTASLASLSTASLAPLSSTSAFVPPIGLDAPTLERLATALSCVNLSVQDLSWDKRPISDDFRLSCVNETLDRPIELAARAGRAAREFEGDPAGSVEAAADWLDLPPGKAALEEPGSRTDRFRSAPPDAERVLNILFAGHDEARRWLERAFEGLTPVERKRIAESGSRLYTDESEDEWDMAPVLEAAKKVDLASLWRAERTLARSARLAREMLAHAHPERWKSRVWRFGDLTVALGGPEDDRHSETIVLDGGGDDIYTGGSFVLDVAGDDLYRGAGQGFSAAALVLDLSGSDRYLGGDFVQGGTAFGASLLIDAAGDDRYESGQCSQGSAFFGIGMLFDLAGSDSYRGARFVQGFGGTRGLGVLSDLSGDDTFYAGGRYKHAPLLPENYQSLSQGFGFGLRGASASGGIGILADHAGNDVYTAEVFGQGASYWYSLGILADAAGHDKYNLYQYGQGAGIHLSSGVLLDSAGHDAYSCNNGVAQGSGHDWGAGLLLDLGGDDAYQGSGMSQGGANANGIGILIDRSGNDSYAGWNVKNQGDSFFARGTIGLGVLLDLGGQDRYTHGGKQAGLWTRGTVGVGYDCEAPLVASSKAGGIERADSPGKDPAPAHGSAPGSDSSPPGAGSAPSQDSASGRKSAHEPASSPGAAGSVAISAIGPSPVSPAGAALSVAGQSQVQPALSEGPAGESGKPASGERQQAAPPRAPVDSGAPPPSNASRTTGGSLQGVKGGASAVRSSASPSELPEPPDLGALWREACLWEVGSNTQKVPAARAALIAQGERTLDYLIPAKLATRDTLVTRALQTVITGIGSGAAARLLPCLESESADIRRNAADLLGALGAKDAAPAIARLLQDPDARLGALSALSVLKDPSTVPAISLLLESDLPERVRITAASTLGAVGGERAEASLARGLASPCAPLRFASQYALEGLKSATVLRAALRESDLRVRLHAIAALGHVKDQSAHSDLRALVADPSPIVRGFAVEALGAIADPEDAALLRSLLTSEADPFARGKIEDVLAGAVP